MEPVSTVASLITLIETTGILVKAGKNVIDAPEELLDVTAQLTVVQAELEHIRRISRQDDDEPLEVDVRKEIAEILRQADDTFDFLYDKCAGMDGNARLSCRIRWACKDRKAVHNVLVRLRSSQRYLDRLLNILSWQIQRKKLNEIISIVSKNVRDRQLVAPGLVPKEPWCHNQSANHCRVVLSRSRPWSLGSYWAALGIKGSFIPTRELHPGEDIFANEQENYVDYHVALHISLPLAYIIGPYAFLMTASIRTSKLCPGQFGLLGGNIILARVVTADDPFISACERGDLLAVQTLLRSGEGRVSDITVENWSPLAFAVLSGNVDVVRELLRHGANKDASFGEKQTTPLQWAIWMKQLDVTRLLLDEGASQEPLTKLGWNVTFYCWPYLESTEENMLKFLNLLEEKCPQDLDLVDTEGWTVLHRVAAYGKPSEVQRLIELGADPAKVALPLRWNAIHHAVFYGNYATFVVLLEHYESDVVSLVDERGWTLLHIAASAGHDDIVRHLLRLNADPIARSKPFRSHMPDVLFDIACTPQQVAAAQSSEREQQYLDAVQDQDQYFDATEHLQS